MIHLNKVSKVVKFKETESRMVVASSWGKGKGGAFYKCRASALQDKMLLTSALQMGVHLTLNNCVIKNAKFYIKYLLFN